MSEIRHRWLDEYFSDRPQLPKPCENIWGYSIPPAWKNVVEKLLSERGALEQANIEIKRLHDLHFERTKLTHKVLLDVEKRNKCIEKLETGMLSAINVCGYVGNPVQEILTKALETTGDKP